MDVFLSNGDNAALVPWLYDRSLRKRIPIEMRLESIIYEITIDIISYYSKFPSITTLTPIYHRSSLFVFIAMGHTVNLHAVRLKRASLSE